MNFHNRPSSSVKCYVLVLTIPAGSSALFEQYHFIFYHSSRHQAIEFLLIRRQQAYKNL